MLLTRVVLRLFSMSAAALLPAVASAQIGRSVEAHGGREKWQSFASVEYDLTYERPKGEKRDHQIFDLRSRDGLITAQDYTLGASKGDVWIKPGVEALGGTPPRFYMWTPFYFFAMPFVFADPGAKQGIARQENVPGRGIRRREDHLRGGHRRFA